MKPLDKNKNLGVIATLALPLIIGFPSISDGARYKCKVALKGWQVLAWDNYLDPIKGINFEGGTIGVCDDSVTRHHRTFGMLISFTVGNLEFFIERNSLVSTEISEKSSGNQSIDK